MSSKLQPVNGFIWRSYYHSQLGIFAKHGTDPTIFEVYPHLKPGIIYYDHVYKKEIKKLLELDETRYGKLFGKAYYIKRRLILKTMAKFFQKNRRRIIISKKVIPTLPTQLKKFFPKADGSLTHYYIDGSVIRECDDQFTHGGHDLIYPWLPAKTVVTDITIDKRDRPFSLAHEQIERMLMAKKLNYDNAHEIAVAFEDMLRRQKGASYPGDANYNFSSELLMQKIFDLNL